MPRRKWILRLGAKAKQDYVDIIRWTAETFGPSQADAYQDLIETALGAIDEDPNVIGSRPRDEIGVGYRIFHIASGRRRGRHIILYRQSPEGEIFIVRILHDSMELPRHLPSDPNEQ